MKKTCILILMAVALARRPPAEICLMRRLRIRGRLTIGMEHGGGIIAYIYQPGDPGYVEGETHGLIAATADQDGGSGIIWGCFGSISQRQVLSRHGNRDWETALVNTDRIIAPQITQQQLMPLALPELIMAVGLLTGICRH